MTGIRQLRTNYDCTVNKVQPVRLAYRKGAAYACTRWVRATHDLWTKIMLPCKTPGRNLSTAAVTCLRRSNIIARIPSRCLAHTSFSRPVSPPFVNYRNNLACSPARPAGAPVPVPLAHAAVTADGGSAVVLRQHRRAVGTCTFFSRSALNNKLWTYARLPAGWTVVGRGGGRWGLVPSPDFPYILPPPPQELLFRRDNRMTNN